MGMEQFQLKLITTNIDCQQCQASNATKPPKRTVGWLVGWMDGCRDDWLPDCQAALMSGFLVGWSEARLVSCLGRTLREAATIHSHGVTQCRSECRLRGR